MRASNKVSKKLKLSKSKVNYRKGERRVIHRRDRREGKVRAYSASETLPCGATMIEACDCGRYPQ